MLCCTIFAAPYPSPSFFLLCCKGKKPTNTQTSLPPAPHSASDSQEQGKLLSTHMGAKASASQWQRPIQRWEKKMGGSQRGAKSLQTSSKVWAGPSPTSKRTRRGQSKVLSRFPTPHTHRGLGGVVKPCHPTAPTPTRPGETWGGALPHSPPRHTQTQSKALPLSTPLTHKRSSVAPRCPLTHTHTRPGKAAKPCPTTLSSWEKGRGHPTIPPQYLSSSASCWRLPLSH